MLLSLIISTVVFFVAAGYFKRRLDDMDIPKGMTRGILVFTLAASVAWGVAAAVNWVQGKPVTPKIPTQAAQPIKEIDP
ncbi:MAG: hypothetical protein ABL902_06870 [Gallionella sp.]|nr:hypothetical protein [Gallionella sp.]